MTPVQSTIVELSELKELELKCVCGTAIRLPLPLKNELPIEQDCLGCTRKFWAQGSQVRVRISALLAAIESWHQLGQDVLHLRFVLDGKD